MMIQIAILVPLLFVGVSSIWGITYNEYKKDHIDKSPYAYTDFLFYNQKDWDNNINKLFDDEISILLTNSGMGKSDPQFKDYALKKDDDVSDYFHDGQANLLKLLAYIGQSEFDNAGQALDFVYALFAKHLTDIAKVKANDGKPATKGNIARHWAYIYLAMVSGPKFKTEWDDGTIWEDFLSKIKPIEHDKYDQEMNILALCAQTNSLYPGYAKVTTDQFIKNPDIINSFAFYIYNLSKEAHVFNINNKFTADDFESSGLEAASKKIMNAVKNGKLEDHLGKIKDEEDKHSIKKTITGVIQASNMIEKILTKFQTDIKTTDNAGLTDATKIQDKMKNLRKDFAQALSNKRFKDEMNKFLPHLVTMNNAYTARQERLNKRKENSTKVVIVKKPKPHPGGADHGVFHNPNADDDFKNKINQRKLPGVDLDDDDEWDD